MAGGITKALLGGKLMFPTEYVAAVEFRGRDVSLTIAGIKVEDLQIKGAKKERKPVLLFKETKKKLVLNKTNAGTIADMYGTEAESWVGKKVTLYPTRTQCGRDTVDCIRVRDQRPKQDTPAPQFDEPEPREEELEDDAFAANPTQQHVARGFHDEPNGHPDMTSGNANPIDGEPPDAEKAEIKLRDLFDSGEENWMRSMVEAAKATNPQAGRSCVSQAMTKYAHSLGMKSASDAGFTFEHFKAAWSAIERNKLDALSGTLYIEQAV